MSNATSWPGPGTLHLPAYKIGWNKNQENSKKKIFNMSQKGDCFNAHTQGPQV